MSYSLSSSEKKYYSDSYGVKVKQDKDGKFNYSGSSDQISKVSGMVNKNKFITENYHKVGNYTSKKGSLSSQLSDYDTSNGYGSVSSSSFSYEESGGTLSF